LPRSFCRKAKFQSNVQWFTHERIAPLWKTIADKFSWQNIKEVTDYLLKTYSDYLTLGFSTQWRANAKKIEAEADAIRIKAEADAERICAGAKDISANAGLKQELRKLIKSREKELRKERKIGPKAVIKPSKQFRQQLQNQGVVWEVKRDKQGNLVILVTKMQSEEYPSEYT